jgi:hypothetical protein
MREGAKTQKRKDANAGRGAGLGKVVARYPYTDEHGTILGEVVRFDPKTFRPRRLVDGQRWEWGQPSGGFPLYRLPDVVEAKSAGRVVFLCYADDTEVLTPDGWQMLPTLPEGASIAQYEAETGAVEFVQPLDRQRFAYSGPMVSVGADWCGLLVTPEHRMLTRWQNTRPEVVTADQMNRGRWLPTSGLRSGQRSADTPTADEARLIAAWQADGVDAARGYRVGWNLKKQRKIDRLRQLLSRCGLDWKEQQFASTEGWTYLSIDRRRADFLDRWVVAKRFGWDLLDWSVAARSSLLDELGHWDGDHPGQEGIRYFTADQQCADVVSAVAAITAYGSIVRRDDRPDRPEQGTQWVVSLVPRDWRCLGNRPTQELYDGVVYCLTVPSGFLVTRRQGKVTIAGNCEGEKDADAVAATGEVATTHAGGAAPATGGGSKWRPEHTAALAGARVVLVADRDGSNAEHPAQGYAGYRHAITVRDALIAAGATVTVVEAVEGKDAADHLAAGHTAAELAGNVVVPEERVPAEVRELWSPGKVLGGPDRFRRGGDDDGPGGSGGGSGGGGSSDDGHELIISRDEYMVVGDCLVKVPGSGRNPDPVEVLGCRARLLRKVRVDLGDGDAPEVTHVDLEAEKDGERVELLSVKWEDFVSGEWTKALPWPVGMKRTHGGKSDVMNAVEQTSGPVPIIPEYGVLGWQQLEDGRWAFLHAGGAIGSAGPIEGVRVRVDPQLKLYELPAASDEDGRAVDVALTLSLLDRLPARIGAPLLGAAFRALLARCRSTVMLVGPPGTYKTSMAAVTLQHHAPTARHDFTPFSASEEGGTSTALEDWRYRVGNMLFLPDDPAPDKGHERAAQRINILARSQYNGFGKGRGKREGGTRPTHAPRGLLLMAAEDGASSESAETRIAYLRVNPGEVSLETLIELGTGDMAEARARCTAAVVQRLATMMPADAWVRQHREQFASLLRDKAAADPGIDAREAETAADLAVGIWALLQAATEWGAVTEAEAADYWSRAFAGLWEAKRQQGAARAGRNMTERAAELLRSAILAGRVHIAGTDGLCPDTAGERIRRWGWASAPGLMTDVRPVSTTCGGWTDGTTLWLDPGAVFGAIQAQSTAEREPLTVTRRALSTGLAGAGLSSTEQTSAGTRYEVRRSLMGVRRRVWELPREWLYDLGNDDGDPVEPTPIAPTAPPFAPCGLDGDSLSVPSAPEPEDATDDEPESPAVTMETPSATATETAPVAAPEPPAEPLSTPEETGTASPGISAASRPRRAPDVGSPYRAALVVCAAAGGVLSTGESVALPDDLVDLAGLLAWAEKLELGMQHRRSRDDAGQVWVQPDLAARLGLPDKEPATGRSKAAAAIRAIVEALRSAGWVVSERGFSDWTNIYREGGRSIQLVLPAWAKSDERRPMWSAEISPAQLAARLARFAAEVGMPAHITPAVSGVSLIRATRAGSAVEVKTVGTFPKPATVGGTEMDYEWQRLPEPDELDCKYAQIFDLNGQYLAAASSVRLGIGDPAHVKAPGSFDPAIPGYHLVEPGPRGDRLLPDLFDPIGRGDRHRVWATTPTLVVAAGLGYELTPIESWLWPDTAPVEDGKAHDARPGSRYLEPWYRLLRDARQRLMAAEAAGDADAAAVLEIVKGCYSKGVGRLNAGTAAEKSPLWRPDWRHHIIATARANLTRKLHKVADLTGRRPLAIWHDAVVYASNEPDPAKDCPAGLRYDPAGIKLGHVKQAGTMPLAELVPLLSTGTHAKVDLMATINAAATQRDEGQ